MDRDVQHLEGEDVDGSGPSARGRREIRQMVLEQSGGWCGREAGDGPRGPMEELWPCHPFFFLFSKFFLLCFIL